LTHYTWAGPARIATTLDASNQLTSYEYDTKKRLIRVKRYPVNGGAEDLNQREEYFYDGSPFRAALSVYTMGREAALGFTTPLARCARATATISQARRRRSG
jgi:YD repeat-containing protein